MNNMSIWNKVGLSIFFLSMGFGLGRVAQSYRPNLQFWENMQIVEASREDASLWACLYLPKSFMLSSMDCVDLRQFCQSMKEAN